MEMTKELTFLTSNANKHVVVSEGPTIFQGPTNFHIVEEAVALRSQPPTKSYLEMKP